MADHQEAHLGALRDYSEGHHRGAHQEEHLEGFQDYLEDRQEAHQGELRDYPEGDQWAHLVLQVHPEASGGHRAGDRPGARGALQQFRDLLEFHRGDH